MAPGQLSLIGLLQLETSNAIAILFSLKSIYYKMKAVKIPHDQLSQEALKGVIEEFVTRNGTDYGETEIPLETKIAQVLTQLKSKDAFIIFDHDSETATIVKKDNQILNSIDS